MTGYNPEYTDDDDPTNGEQTATKYTVTLESEPAEGTDE